MIMNNFFGVYKTLDSNGDYLIGYATYINGETFLQINYNDQNAMQLYPVETIHCAREICRLPNNESLFEYDMFETINGELFYITFDITNFAVVYNSATEFPLPDNINLFECQYVKNIRIE